jgi:CHAD domain-containing protein
VARVERRAAGAAIAAVAAAAAVYERRARERRRAHGWRYRFAADQPLDAEIHRALDGQLDQAVAALARSDSDEGVHEARKSIKRLRSLVRLMREELADDRYSTLNAELRDAGQALGTARDAAAVTRALDTVVDAQADHVSASELARVRERLRASQARADLGTGGADTTIERLEAIRRELAALTLGDGLDPLLAGLRRSQRRGRRAARAARERPTTERLHQWRKRVKDLRYQAELLREADPKRLRAIRAQARELSDVLGEDHDLAMLARTAADCATLIPLIAHRRAELAARAFELGDELHARPPRRLVRRVRRRATRRTAW